MKKTAYTKLALVKGCLTRLLLLLLNSFKNSWFGSVCLIFCTGFGLHTVMMLQMSIYSSELLGLNQRPEGHLPWAVATTVINWNSSKKENYDNSHSSLIIPFSNAVSSITQPDSSSEHLLALAAPLLLWDINKINFSLQILSDGFAVHWLQFDWHHWTF